MLIEARKWACCAAAVGKSISGLRMGPAVPTMVGPRASSLLACDDRAMGRVALMLLVLGACGRAELEPYRGAWKLSAKSLEGLRATADGSLICLHSGERIRLSNCAAEAHDEYDA
ncbi:MAG: hypothetical protein IAG13_21600 [Deltaproteobacteria bacterium]|nr:hypothetical protein [Nannocystaceae bacterium]